ncbi:MAG: hypothetical protein Q4D45_05165 [Lachnospiraceae bacterium]|nr:hypothetical protein [Lachnospiraceae bacterium]
MTLSTDSEGNATHKFAIGSKLYEINEKQQKQLSKILKGLNLLDNE